MSDSRLATISATKPESAACGDSRVIVVIFDDDFPVGGDVVFDARSHAQIRERITFYSIHGGTELPLVRPTTELVTLETSGTEFAVTSVVERIFPVVDVSVESSD